MLLLYQHKKCSHIVIREKTKLIKIGYYSFTKNVRQKKTLRSNVNTLILSLTGYKSVSIRLDKTSGNSHGLKHTINKIQKQKKYIQNNYFKKKIKKYLSICPHD